MINRIIDKNAFAGFVDELLETHRVIAPTKQDGIVSFERVESINAIRLDYNNTRQAPKSVFFPRSETLFSYRQGEMTAVPLSDQPRVVVGIRPCDARSPTLLDKVFDTPDSQDPYYVGRRENTVLVGLACNTPLSTCFCTAVGGGPFWTEGLDLLLTDLGDRYMVEVASERGEVLIAEHPDFRPATEEDLKLKAEIAAHAEAMVSGPDVTGITEKLDGLYDDSVWDEIQQKCLGCGVCTYLCPTCHCFDIVDEGDSRKGRRVRNWDTCQFALFTHHASGHNPRPTGKERMRQRVMHKFNYFVHNLGEIACVGCGRCVRDCPVNLDIRAVIETIGQVGER
jgi:sulfhydrogenase subunit beta (sulfur reductase)